MISRISVASIVPACGYTFNRFAGSPARKKNASSPSQVLGVDRQYLVDVSGCQHRCYACGVRGRAHLRDVEPGQAVADDVYRLLDVDRHQAERLGRAGAGGEGGVYAVYVQRQVDALVLDALQGGLDGFLDPGLHDLVRAYEPHRVVPVQLLFGDRAAPDDEHVVQPEVLRRPPGNAGVAVRCPEVLVAGVQVRVYRYQRDVVLVEASHDGDVDAVLPAQGYGELPVPDGGADAE